MTRRKDTRLPRRKRNRRPQKRTILIVAEGKETEPNYFDGLMRAQRVRDRYAVTIKTAKGLSRTHIVKEAIRKKKAAESKYDEVWCVFDTECLLAPEARKDYDEAILLAKDNGIKTAISNPSFEVWLLAHFKRSSRHFKDGNAVIVELNKGWQKSFRTDYDKADGQVYRRVASRTEQAITNARDVREKDHADKDDIAHCNSATEVYLLVERLLKGGERHSS